MIITASYIPMEARDYRSMAYSKWVINFETNSRHD